MKKKVDSIYSRYTKRVLDIICCILALVAFWWLYLIVAVIVRIKLGSPVIFKQERPGRTDPKTGEDRIFELYKFRSMSNAKDEDGNLLPDSERLTKFGRVLRATSLDELPEIFNILRGDMSLVGPRPWAVSYLKYFTENERKRHLVRPGLSGWAQVNGRTAATWDERLSFDLEYVEKISFCLDVKIIFMTIKNVIAHKDIVEAGEQGDFSTYRKKQWEAGVVPKPSVVAQSNTK